MIHYVKTITFIKNLVSLNCCDELTPFSEEINSENQNEKEVNENELNENEKENEENEFYQIEIETQMTQIIDLFKDKNVII